MNNRLAQFWQNLQTRERMTILLGGALVLVTACYLLFDNLWTDRSLLLETRAALIEEREWMQEQAALSEQLNNSCTENQILTLSNTDLLELLAIRNQLALESFTETVIDRDARYSLSLESTDGNNILRFIHQSACQGFSLANLQINKSDSEPYYLGQVEFSHEG